MQSTEPHPLSPVDHLFAGYTTSIVFRFADRLDGERLATSLTTVLACLPPLAGGLVELAGGARYGFAPLTGPVRWLESREVPRLPEDASAPGALGELMPRLLLRPGQPLLGARLTSDPSGSVLGVTVAHAVTDGHGLFTFLRLWSRAALGRSIEPPPWDRRLLAVEPPASAPPMTPEGVWRKSGFSWCPQRRRSLDVPRPASFGEWLVLPDPRSLAEDRPLSDNDLLCAWLIKRYASGLSGPDGLAVMIPVDFRRSHGGLPHNYFGNAVRGVPLWLPRDILERESIPELAARVQGAVRGVLDARSARDAVECLDQVLRERGLQVLSELHLVNPEVGLLISNIAHLPFGMLDFGCGLPVRAVQLAVEPRTMGLQQTDKGFEASILTAPA